MRRLFVVLFVAVAGACGDPLPPEPEDPSVTIGPLQSHMKVGTTQQLQVTVTGIEDKAVYYGYRAHEVPGQSEAIARYIVRLNRVSGEFLANSVGSTTLVVRSRIFGDKFDTVTISVDPPPAEQRISFKSVATETGRTCAISFGDETYCWGANRAGGLGVTATSFCGFGREETDFRCNPLPGRVNGPSFAAITVGADHSCGLTQAGTVFCWGQNLFGEVGNGTSSPVTAPVQVSLPERIISLSAGTGRTCAVGSGGSLYCWGIIRGSVSLDPFGGTGCFAQGRCVSSPQLVEGLSIVTRVSAGHSHTCALQADGAAFCWGPNFLGELGTGDFVDTNVPRRVQTTVKFSDISVGWGNTCALTSLGEAYCWGRTGRLSISCAQEPDICSPLPRLVNTPHRFVEIVGKENGACGLTTQRELLCWGFAHLIGRIEIQNILTPTRVLEGSLVSSIASGYRSCAIVTSGAAYCWGTSNTSGELGNGTVTVSIPTGLFPTPVAVEGPP